MYGTGVMSTMAAHLATMNWSINAFFEDLGDQQPANMHFTGDAGRSIWSFLFRCHIQDMWGNISKATRGSLTYISAYFSLHTTAVFG